MKKGLGFTFTILGAIALIYGIVIVFKGGMTDSNSWIAMILGAIFFTSGIGLLKSTSGGETQNNA